MNDLVYSQIKRGDRDSETIFTDILYLILDFHLDREFTIQ